MPGDPAVADLFVADPHQSGQFIINEENGYWSRATVTLAGGSGRVATGTVLAKRNTDGKFVPCVDTASDGSDVPAGILWEDQDATSSDVQCAIVARKALVYAGALVWDASITDKQTKLLQLASACGIAHSDQDDPATRFTANQRYTIGY